MPSNGRDGGTPADSHVDSGHDAPLQPAHLLPAEATADHDATGGRPRGQRRRRALVHAPWSHKGSGSLLRPLRRLLHRHRAGGRPSAASAYPRHASRAGSGGGPPSHSLPEVFLRPLASRLLRLLLQCLARFALWLDSMLVVDAASKPGAPPAPSSSATAADEAPGEESAGCQLIGALAEAAGATTLLLDLLRVLAWLRGELRPRLIALLHLPSRGPADDAPAEGGEAGEGDELAADCLAAYDEGVASLQTRVRLLRASLVARQANECSAYSPLRGQSPRHTA